jgi:hypothetical protein
VRRQLKNIPMKLPVLNFADHSHTYILEIGSTGDVRRIPEQPKSKLNPDDAVIDYGIQAGI